MKHLFKLILPILVGMCILPLSAYASQEEDSENVNITFDITVSDENSDIAIIAVIIDMNGRAVASAISYTTEFSMSLDIPRGYYLIIVQNEGVSNSIRTILIPGVETTVRFTL